MLLPSIARRVSEGFLASLGDMVRSIRNHDSCRPCHAGVVCGNMPGANKIGMVSPDFQISFEAEAKRTISSFSLAALIKYHFQFAYILLSI